MKELVFVGPRGRIIEDPDSDVSFLVSVRPRNNHLLRALHALGFKRLADFCAIHGISFLRASRLLGFKMTPFLEKGEHEGEYRPLCKKIAEKLGKRPDALFPRHLYERMMGSVAECKEPLVVEMSSGRFRPLEEIPARFLTGERFEIPETGAMRHELEGLVRKILDVPGMDSDWGVICCRFCLSGVKKQMTFKQIGQMIGLTRQGVKERERRILNLLREELPRYGYCSNEDLAH